MWELLGKSKAISKIKHLKPLSVGYEFKKLNWKQDLTLSGHKQSWDHKYQNEKLHIIAYNANSIHVLMPKKIQM